MATAGVAVTWSCPAAVAVLRLGRDWDCIKAATRADEANMAGSATRHSIVSRLFALVAITLASVPPGSGQAQSGNRGDGHAFHHDWYRDLKTKSGWSCCSGDEGGGDCRPVQARQQIDGQWEAYVHGEWREIPPEAILGDELNKAPLQAHICERADFIYCFLRAGSGS
jgi:hypothetical protein